MLAIFIKNPILQRLLMVLASLALYFISLELTKLLPQLLIHDNWIYLVFLPAGSRLLSIMLFGIWGAIGDCIALFISAMNFFPEQQIAVWLTFATTSSLSSLIAIRLTMKQLKINLDLSNLQYWQIPALSIISNLAHAFVTQLTLSHFIQKHYEFYVRDSLAMAVGDFLGTMLMIGAVTVGIKLFNARKTPN
jgi:hypothetical protein